MACLSSAGSRFVGLLGLLGQLAFLLGLRFVSILTFGLLVLSLIVLRSFTQRDVGKKVKSSKKRFVWEVIFKEDVDKEDASQHTCSIELKHSVSRVRLFDCQCVVVGFALQVGVLCLCGHPANAARVF